MSRLFLVSLLAVLVLPVRAQDSLDVTFRFLPDLTQPVVSATRVFVPGAFNDWGPNTSGRIAPTAASLATYDAATNEWRYTKRLRVGSTYAYKLHFHYNASGSSYSQVWPNDPLNNGPRDGDGNSLVTVRDPMVFQLAREQEGTDAIVAVSASVFSRAAITALTFQINDGAPQDGLPYFSAAPFAGESGLFRYALPAPVPPGSFFKITATDTRGRVVSDSIGTIPPVVVDAPRPAGLRDGVYVENGMLYASLFAPGKRYVKLLGDVPGFGWRSDEGVLLKRDSVSADSVWFWLDGYPASPEFDPVGSQVQYLVDGLIRVADPDSEDVLNPGDPGYPTGLTEHPVTVVTAPMLDVPAPTCDLSAYERPKPQDLVVYELLLRDFQDAHSFDALRDTLDYLDRLGITAIELMPVSEFDGDLSWGYNPAFHFAVDGYYGSRESLKRLVDEAHCRGIAVILDVVYNHATGQSPLIRLWNGSATGSPSATPTADNPYANTSARHPFNVFNDLNHDSPATRYWLDRANRYWLETFGVDGFRYDLSKGFTQCDRGGANGCPNNQGTWDSYDPSRIYNLKRMADEVWSYDPDALLILEHLSQLTEERELAAYRTGEGRPGFLLWRKMMGPFNEATMGYHDGGKSNIAGAYFGAGGQGFSVPNTVSILEDHDEQRLMRKNALYGNTGPNGYSVKATATSLDRMKAAGAFFFTLPGPKMIWQFGELGYGAANDECLPEQDSCPGGRTDSRDDGWDYRPDSTRYALYQTWSALLNLRQSYDVFTDPATQVELSTVAPVKRIKLSRDTLQVVVVGNFDVAAQDVVPAFHQTGTWYDYFGRTALEVSDVNATIPLAPGGFRVYTNHYVGYAPPNIVVAVDEAPVPSALALSPSHPNPVRGTAALTFALPEAQEARVEVFDALGRRVAVLAEGLFTPGTHPVTLDAAALPSGLYLVRLVAGGEARTRSVTVVR